MQWLDFFSRFVHIATAIVLVGGSVFSLFVVAPALVKIGEDERRKLYESLTNRWKMFVHFGIVLFLASGLYNYIRAIPNHKGDGLYHALLGTKMLLALVVFFIAAALVGRSQKLEGMRQARMQWLRIMVIVATVIVGMSGFVKVRGTPIKPAVDQMIAVDKPLVDQE